ncbi:MAG: gliding motility-associated protein GldE [Bacteroidia bacterium]
MKTDSEPFQQILLLISSEVHTSNVAGDIFTGVIGLIVILFFLFLSGLFSSAENAFFSLSPSDLVLLNEEDSHASKTALELINDPDRKTATQRLLATILVMNNLVNVFIIIFSSFLFDSLFSFQDWITPFFMLKKEIIAFSLQVVLITFLLVLLGEIIPKIYATKNNLKVVRFMGKPLQICYRIFKPIILGLSASSSLFDKYLKKQMHNISVEEISQAIDIADENKEIEEKHILKGIINFGNTSVKQIMKPRTEVSGIDISTDAHELLSTIVGWSYSRIPVYEDTFDQVRGILYVKDLLPHIHKKTNFNWQNLLKQPFYVPEHKKIDDLLQEFQDKRVHMAIVVDEYGGTKGIVTMEDILEEVFGEIKDEFDDIDEISFTKIDELTYQFEGKTPLLELCKILNFTNDYFEKVRGDADTIGGLLMEIEGKIPNKGTKIILDTLSFTIIAADNRRIKRVQLKLDPSLIINNED